MRFVFRTNGESGLTDIEYVFADANDALIGSWTAAGVTHSGERHIIDVERPATARTIKWRSPSRPEFNYEEDYIDERGATGGGGSVDVDEGAIAGAVVSALRGPDAPVLVPAPDGRWFTLTAAHLKAAGHGHLVDKARTVATGGIDPVDNAIQAAVARIHRAIAPGNILDVDVTKIPRSFQQVAERLALYGLMERIGLDLSEDQRGHLRDINSDLNRTADSKLKVEQPDNAQATSTMQTTGVKVSAVNVPRRQTGRERTAGL
jgi:hypothetical protein